MAHLGRDKVTLGGYVMSNDVWGSPEWIAFAKRFGIPLPTEMRQTSVTVCLEINDAMRVTIDFIGEHKLPPEAAAL